MPKIKYRSLKEHDTGVILKKIIEEEDTTRIKISKETGFPKSAVSDIVNLLIKKNVIIESRKGQSQIGKKPIILKLNGDYQLILALVIGQTDLVAIVANLRGKIIYKIEHKNYPRGDREQILNSVINIIDKILLNEANLLKRINNFSIGTHGVVNPNTNVITNAPYLKNWSGVNLVEILSKRYQKQIILNNSNNLGAVGEQWKNYGKIKNLIYIDIENGIGAGVILNGKLITGSKGATGEIAYLPILKELDINKLRKNKLELGLFESQVDINGIVKTVKRQLLFFKDKKHANNLNIFSDFENINFQKICEYYKNDSYNFIKEIIDEEIIRILATGIAAILSVIDLELIIINGDILELGESFIKKLQNEIFLITPFKCEIVPSKLRQEAHISGAIKKGIDYINDLFYYKAFDIIN